LTEVGPRVVSQCVVSPLGALQFPSFDATYWETDETTHDEKTPSSDERQSVRVGDVIEHSYNVTMVAAMVD